MKKGDLLISLLSKEKIEEEDKKKIFSLLKNPVNQAYLYKKSNKKQFEKLYDLINKKDREYIKNSLKIINEFNKNKINFVVLKGLTFKKFNKTRISSDLDLFIDKSDFQRALKICKKWYHYSLSDKEIKRIIKFRLFGYHHITLINPEFIMLELNLSLLVLPYFINSEKLDLKHNKIYLRFHKSKIPCLIPEMQLFHSLMHLFMHCIMHGLIINREVKWLNDIDLILANYKLDWDKFIRIAKDFNCLEIIYILIKKINKSKKDLVPNDVLGRMYSYSSKWRLYLLSKFYNKYQANNNHKILQIWALLLNLYPEKLFELILFFFLKGLFRFDREIAVFLKRDNL